MARRIAEQQVIAILRRVGPMSLGAFVGGVFASLFTNSAIAALVVLPVKVFLDIRGHLRAHESALDQPTRD
jgi:ABC-type multidrug transport system permease subunit